MKKRKRKRKSDLSGNVALGVNDDMLIRYGEAGKQFKVAYDGVDNETEQKLHQGLKQIGKWKATSINKNGKVVDHTKTQQGYSAEVLDTAKQNANNIKLKKSERIARTDDVINPATGKKRINDRFHDQVTLDTKGKIIADSGVQLKFYTPNSFVDSVINSWSKKYPDGIFRVPTDQYEEIKRKLLEEIKKNENFDNLSSEQKKKLEYIKKVHKNLKKSEVSKMEAIEARKSPKKVIVKEIGKASHEAGVEAAKIGITIGGGISVITNTIAVIKGDKEPKDAVLAVSKDITVAGTTSYGIGFANTTLASILKNSEEGLLRQLGKANAPAYIIQTAISTTKSLYKLCCEELTLDEFFLEIGKNGTSLLASVQGAVVGQLLIPIPIVGALVGGLVSTMLCEKIYDYTIGMRMLNEDIDAFSNLLSIEIARLKECQIRLMNLNINKYRNEIQKYAEITDSLDDYYSEPDFNAVLKLTYRYLDIPYPWGTGSLDEFIKDKTKKLVYN